MQIANILSQTIAWAQQYLFLTQTQMSSNPLSSIIWCTDFPRATRWLSVFWVFFFFFPPS